jgi:glycerophosphoryl diester phosphodiesterase
MTHNKNKFRLAETFIDVRRHFIGNLSDLLIFDIFFKIIVTTVFGPISAWIINRLIASGGAYVIGNEQIIAFVLSPIGIVAVIVSGTLALAIIFAEQAGIVSIAARSRFGSPIKSYQAFFGMLKHLRVLIELGARQVIIGLLYLAPLATMLVAAYYYLNSRYDLNFLLVEKPPPFWLGAAIAGCIGICGILVIGVLYIGWVFSVPFCVLEGEDPATALRKSRDLVSGNFWRIGLILAGWALLIAATGVIITFALDLLDEFVLNQIGDNPTVVIPTVCILLGFYGLTAAALTFIGFTANCLLIAGLYYEIREANGILPAMKPNRLSAGTMAGPARRRVVWAIFILTLIMTSISSYVILDRIDLDHPVAVTAHRGSSMDAPENTLSAIRQAIDDGADYAEIDVQETADGEIVLLHDTDLVRIAGVNKKIWQITYAEIKLLDAGSWFAPRFKGEHIPTLAEALAISGNKIKLNIELKFNGHEKQLVESVVKIVRNHKFGPRCIIASLNYSELRKVKNLDPSLKTGFIIARSIGDMFRADTDILSLSSSIVNADVIAAARKRQKEVHVWTVNQPAAMTYFINLGVDNIITDYPAKLVSVVNMRASLNDVEKFLLAAADMLK